MTDATLAPPAPGRSLWADAWARLRANRAATVSAVYLALMILACIVGPLLTPHAFTTIYQDYTRVPPSLSAYPKEDTIAVAVDDAVRRAKLDLSGFEMRDGRVFISVASEREIDERVTRYIDRSTVFEGAKLEEIAPDGKSLTMSADVEQMYFLFGTDNNGRDLLTRTLIAGRVSLAIGLLAGIVAVVIGVLYGATAGFIGGKTDEVMMRIVDILYSLPFIFFVIMLVVFFGRNFVLMFLAVGAVLVARHGADRARAGAVDPKAGICAGGRGAGGDAGRHPDPAYRAEPAGAGGDLHDAAGAAGDHPRKLPVLPRAGGAGADGKLGRADFAGRQEHSGGELAADVPGLLPDFHPVRAELHRRRAARCA